MAVLIQETANQFRILDLDPVEINESDVRVSEFDLIQYTQIMGFIEFTEPRIQSDFLVLFLREHALGLVLFPGDEVDSLNLGLVIELFLENKVINFGEPFQSLYFSVTLVQLL